jgi:tRNA(fMet)-specific endonuclease VapC
MSYMLDTNIVSFLLRGNERASRCLAQTPPAEVAISVITEAEIEYGLARRPQAVRLRRAVDEFLRRATVVDWRREDARCYGALRARLEKEGTSIAAHDLLIATHALRLDAVLVSSDPCFRRIPGLKLTDWTAAPSLGLAKDS